jgi:hypothetical protein
MPEIGRRSCGVTDRCCISSWHGVIHLEEEIDTLLGRDGRWEKMTQLRWCCASWVTLGYCGHCGQSFRSVRNSLVPGGLGYFCGQ